MHFAKMLSSHKFCLLVKWIMWEWMKEWYVDLFSNNFSRGVCYSPLHVSQYYLWGWILTFLFTKNIPLVLSGLRFFSWPAISQIFGYALVFLLARKQATNQETAKNIPADKTFSPVMSRIHVEYMYLMEKTQAMAMLPIQNMFEVINSTI